MKAIAQQEGVKILDKRDVTSTNRFMSAAKLEKAFDYQLKHYQELLKTFETNLFTQAAFIIFGILTLFRKDPEFEVPIIKLKLQRSWLYFLVPITLLFLWLRFGFLLDSLIKTRLYGWELFWQLADSPTKEYLRSGAALFEDSGFMDGWFAWFRTEHMIDKNAKALVEIIFPTVFGLLLGANHAMILALSDIGNFRVQNEVSSRPWLRYLLRAVPPVLFFFLVISHVLFYVGGHNPNWFQSVIVGFAISIFVVLVALTRSREAVAPEAALLGGS